MNNSNDKNKARPENIDTRIEIVRLKEKGSDFVISRINSTTTDESGGITQWVITEAVRDTSDTPIMKEEDIAGKCKVCGGAIRKGQEIRCAGRCGELMCEECYQKQGAHVLFGMKLCRWDYWMTKFFWQWFSPSIRKPKGVERDEKETDFGKSSS